MPISDRQKLITQLVSKVLGQGPVLNQSFGWMANKHSTLAFKEHASWIESIFMELKGNIVQNEAKRTQLLKCDAYFGGEYKFIFEFDEFQHFSSRRLLTLLRYPDKVPLNFMIGDWMEFCRIHHGKADAYRKNKMTLDFNFNGGRTAQRAYLDCFRDLLPPLYDLNPTLRICEFEVSDISKTDAASCKKIEFLLKKKMH
jgi:hypothetical protein